MDVRLKDVYPQRPNVQVVTCLTYLGSCMTERLKAIKRKVNVQHSQKNKTKNKLNSNHHGCPPYISALHCINQTNTTVRIHDIIAQCKGINTLHLNAVTALKSQQQQYKTNSHSAFCSSRVFQNARGSYKNFHRQSSKVA